MSVVAALVRRRPHARTHERPVPAFTPTPGEGNLSAASGLCLDAYRREHVAECVRRSLQREGQPHTYALARRLSTDPAARERFRRSVAVSVTGLFRDPRQFELLAMQLPQLRARRSGPRVWSAGCANGSELYSVGMMLDRAGMLDRAQLLGSDLLAENIAAARATAQEAAIPEAVRSRARWEVRDLVRENAPGGAWTLVLCRNVAIYLAPEAKAALHAKLAGALAPGGLLMLGRSERLLRPEELGLARIAPQIYRRHEQ